VNSVRGWSAADGRASWRGYPPETIDGNAHRVKSFTVVALRNQAPSAASAAKFG
jgi:hypothetical protein